MKRPLAGLRLGVILLFLLGFLSPIATIGAGAQTFSCEDLTATQAQALLDADPDLEDDLDPDGDGEACNHEDSRSGQDDGYLAAVQDELDYLGGTFDRFLELDDEAGSADEDDLTDIVDEINAIAAEWVAYPDVAAELVAPTEFEDVEAEYLDLAELVGESGELWEEYWAIPAGDPDEDAALDDFNDAFIGAQDQLDAVQSLVDDGGGSGGNTDPDATEESTEEATEDGTEEATEEATEGATEVASEEATEEATEGATEEATEGATEEATEDATGDDADEYLADVQDELDYLGDTFDRFVELNEEAETADEADLADIVDQINAIAADWVEYPDVAADLIAPEGLEDIEDAYLDLADLVGEAGELWEEYWAIPAGDPEEEAAFDAFIDAFIDVQDQLDVVQTLVDDASGSGGSTDPNATEEGTEEATEQGTEEAIVEGTEEAAEATDEATEVVTETATEEATEAATEEATDEATEEAIEEGTEEAPEEATEEAGGGVDTDAYIGEVPDTADASPDSVDRFKDLLRADLTDAEVDERSEILFAR